ncbi:DUF3617 domain-containing protein [Curvibacter sp. APW13]|uniref:DUF3617 domain-containing protein n=1 Tax=Curvibacter sp. APW13 TaxID=3077236 RepID=UPI0028E09858|nr:DUF3617 domain-containing protein [Curvibacter sp. APW13]MDT8990733.1 DUF3617 domain-containing protein [Curvibacter sp. APW13]
MPLLRAITTVGLTACAALGHAQTLQPGLWEITTQMQGAQGGRMAGAMEQMNQQMASMSPEQRKMVQDMMAKQGMQMGGPAGDGGMRMKVCMSKDMAERNEIPAERRGDCKHTQSPRVGNTMKYSFTCTNPPSSGEGEVTFQGREAYSMRMAMTTTVKGQPEKMDMQGSGKWLGADCGNIKPLGQSPGK